MIQEGLFLSGRDAELLSRMLSQIKTKAYEESGTSLDDTQALDALFSRFRGAAKPSREKDAHRTYNSPSKKHLLLGTIIGKHAKNV